MLLCWEEVQRSQEEKETSLNVSLQCACKNGVCTSVLVSSVECVESENAKIQKSS